MADEETATIEELLTKIQFLEAELDEMQGKVDRLEKLEKACYDLANKLATERDEALIDWWFPV